MKTDDFPHKWQALIGLSLLSFTAFLDYTIVTTALPFIQKDLQASVLQLQWVLNIFMMILCMSMIFVGQCGDLFGRKKVFFIGFIIFGLAAIGAGSSTSIQMLTFFRAVQGLGAAIIFTIGVALIPQAFPSKEQTRAIGIFSAFNGAGLAIGPFLSGILLTLLNWRWVFWINIPFILIGMFLCMPNLKSSQISPRSTKIDVVGLILLVLGLGTLVYGIINGEQTGFSSIKTILTILSGIIALTCLFFYENRITNPLLDTAIFKNTGASLAMVSCVVAGFITSVFMFFDPLYLQLIRNESAFVIGLVLLSVPIVQVIISLLLNTLVSKYGVFNLLVFGIVTAILASILHAFFTPNINLTIVVIALILMGYSWGIANAGSITAVSTSVSEHETGAAIGTIFTFWNISGSVFLALSAVLFHYRESIVFNNLLSNNHLNLSSTQSQNAEKLITNPEQARNILQHFVGNESLTIFKNFETSFMSGFHWVAWLGVFITFIALLISLVLLKNKKQ